MDAITTFAAVAPTWVLVAAGGCAFVSLLVFLGRAFSFRGEVIKGRWASDHLSCRSLAWLDTFGRTVSYPGDARPAARRETRVGKWRKEGAPLEKGWRYVGAEEAHKATEAAMKKLYGKEVILQGEAAGRQTWIKDADGPAPPAFSPAKNPNASDLLFRNQRMAAWKGTRPDEKSVPKTPAEATKKAITFFQQLLCDDGHVAGDYGGPMFLMPGLIISTYCSGVPLGPRAAAMITYLRNHQQEDGGWGTHIESPSTMFGTSLSYVSLRLLGVPASDPAAKAGLKWIRGAGGCTQAPSWSKFWLTLLGVHEWAGINSIPAELWMLPESSPFHPGKWWCHCRMVYLPMCYLYSTRFENPGKHTDPLMAALRSELYLEPYESIDWDKHRHSCCPLDEYQLVTPLQRTLHWILTFYETKLALHTLRPFSGVRKAGIKFAMDYIRAEDLQTNFIDIGPVSKSLNMLCVFVDGGNNNQSDDFLAHVARIDDYLWVAEDGMKMQGYNGSQAWDTSFAMQAVLESGIAEEFPEFSLKVHQYLERSQILSTPASQASTALPYEEVDMRLKYFRHVSKGGWPFSTSAHGWPIADCTAEGLKAVLGLQKLPCVKANSAEMITPERLYDAVHVLLTYQNADGGWATYENNRGYRFYEWLNPCETFGDIMIDYSYVELSSASMTALAAFQRDHPSHRTSDIAGALKRGAKFIKTIQRSDGSWYGSWAVCFTYGTWFGIEALKCAGQLDCASVRRGVAFLISKQESTGGWGETIRSCLDKNYDSTPEASFGQGSSGVVQTAWAVLALMAAEVSAPAEVAAVERGVKFLMSRQLPSGDWPQEGITGVFNRSCGITYTSYRTVFPIWALARHAHWRKTLAA